MFRFFRIIREKLLFEGKGLRYLKYAIGEIFLVVIGILIALQINNANQQRIENDALWGYLSNIRSNITTDLNQISHIDFIKDQLAANTPKFWEIRSSPDFGFTEYRLAEDHLGTIFFHETFSANIFGFETLKSTGYIGKLQGTDMEILLFNYYDQLEKIKTKLNRDRSLMDNIIMELQTNDWNISADIGYRIMHDSILFNQVKQDYVKMLNSPLIDSATSMYSFNEFYIMRYQLEFLGKSIISLIDAHSLEASPQIMRSVELYNSDFSGVGEEEVVINGIIPRSVTIYTDSNQGFDKLKVKGKEDHLEFQIEPGLEWAAAMFVVDSLGQNLRAGKDFTEFKSIELELKGELGNEEVLFTVKDKDDPDDGTEARVTLQLTKAWKRHRFDLRDDLPTGDLKNLHVLAGFISLDPGGGKFYVRNIRYLKE